MTSAYFIGSYIEFTSFISKYNYTHNMTTGCVLNVTPCTDMILCHEPFYMHCTGEGLMALCISIIPISASVSLFIIIACSIYGEYLHRNTDIYDETPILINNDVLYEL